MSVESLHTRAQIWTTVAHKYFEIQISVNVHQTAYTAELVLKAIQAVTYMMCNFALVPLILKHSFAYSGFPCPYALDLK